MIQQCLNTNDLSVEKYKIRWDTPIDIYEFPIIVVCIVIAKDLIPDW